MQRAVAMVKTGSTISKFKFDLQLYTRKLHSNFHINISKHNIKKSAENEFDAKGHNSLNNFDIVKKVLKIKRTRLTDEQKDKDRTYSPPPVALVMD